MYARCKHNTTQLVSSLEILLTGSTFSQETCTLASVQACVVFAVALHARAHLLGQGLS